MGQRLTQAVVATGSGAAGFFSGAFVTAFCSSLAAFSVASAAYLVASPADSVALAKTFFVSAALSSVFF